MTPGEAIRSFCIDCVGGVEHYREVRECGGDHCLNGGCDSKGGCLFFPYRMGHGRPSVKLIRKTCLWCMGGSQDLVRECWTEGCALHPFRLGRNPNIILSGDERFRRMQLIKQAVGGKMSAASSI
jgi:hypothetical protein